MEGLYKGEKEDYTTYIYDEDTESKEDPANYDDVIVWLYMQHSGDIVQVYAINSSSITRDGKTYDDVDALSVSGNDMTFTVQPEDTEAMEVGNIIFQMDVVSGGVVDNKYIGTLTPLYEAK